MVVGITHGKNQKSPEKQGEEDIARQESARKTDIIVMRFIEGPKKNQQ